LQFERKLADNIKEDKKSFCICQEQIEDNITATVGTLLSTDGSVMENPSDIANEFNRYFASVFTKEDQSNLPEPKPLLSDHDMELQDLDITEYHMFQKLNSLRTDKAQDNVSPRQLARIAQQIAKPVHQIFKKIS